MADEDVVNDVPVEKVDGQVEEREDFFYSENQEEAELLRKIEALEKAKRQLLHENDEIKGEIEDMAVQIDGLKKDKAEMNEMLGAMKIEVEVEEEGKNVMDCIAERAAELEMEVSQLQHDLVAAMTEGEEAAAEVTALQITLEEKEGRILHLEKEFEALKKAKADSEKCFRELERKIGVLELKESELKSEKIRVKEEMREKIVEKEVEIVGQKKKVEDLEFVIARNGAELQKCIKDKNGAEEVLRVSEESMRSLELKMVHMETQVGEAEKVISILKEKTLESVNGITSREIITDAKVSEVQWPMVSVGSTGVIVAVAAVVFAVYCRQR